MNLKKLSPWNWFKHEEGSGSNVPVSRQSQYGFPVGRLHNEIDRLFDDFFSAGKFPSLFDNSGFFNNPALLKPNLDIAEDKENYNITVEVPGVDEKDIKIDVNDNLLTIRGEKRHEQKSSEDKYHSIERSYGAFQRTLSLPANTDNSKITAKFKNGVLNIVIAKKEHSKPEGRTINIEQG